MNHNDMDRYFWRTGQRWSGDLRPVKASQSRRFKLGWKTILVLLVVYTVTLGLPILRLLR